MCQLIVIAVKKLIGAALSPVSDNENLHFMTDRLLADLGAEHNLIRRAGMKSERNSRGIEQFDVTAGTFIALFKTNCELQNEIFPSRIERLLKL
jgi:hypothetical protein